MSSTFVLLVVIAVLIPSYLCEKPWERNPPKLDHKINLPTTRPLNIGHRGTGLYPEHTVAGYERAIADNADIIECDVYVTKDLQLVCMHEPFLGKHTDINNRPQFGDDRKSTHTVPIYGEVTDFYCFDFTLEELKTLRVVQQVDIRDQTFNGMYTIPSLDEYIATVKGADRPVGINPELKNPTWVNSLSVMNGSRIEDLFVDALKRHGYSEAHDPCIIQCFDADALAYMKQIIDVPLMIMVWNDPQYLGPFLNDSKIQEWATMFYGLGAWKGQVALQYTLEAGYKNWISGTTDLIQQVKDAGMKIHVYMFSNEATYLAWDFSQDPVEEYRYFMDFGIDGFFNDYPKTFDYFLNSIYKEEAACTSAAPSTGSMVWAMVSAIVAVLYF